MAELKSHEVLSRFPTHLGICKLTLSPAITPTPLEEERVIEIETQVDSKPQSGAWVYWLTGSKTIELDGLYAVKDITVTVEDDFYGSGDSSVEGTKTCLTIFVRSKIDSISIPTAKSVVVTISYTKTLVKPYTDWQSLSFSDGVFNKYALQGVRCYIEDVDGYFGLTGFDSLWDYTPINVREMTYQLVHSTNELEVIKLHMDWLSLRYQFEYNFSNLSKILEWQSKIKELVFILYPYCSKNF